MGVPLKHSQKGFTIIEVMIVLVIAAVILLIVFLAIPALQRNSRNTQRTAEAARIANLVSTCMANRNHLIASCSSGTDIGFVATDFIQLSTTPAFANGGSTAPTSSTTQAGVWFGRICASDGGSSNPSTNPKALAVLYTLEPSVTRCINN